MSAVMSRALLPIEIRNHTAACRSRRKYPDCMLRHTRASTALPEPIPIAGCGYPLAGQAGLEPASAFSLGAQIANMAYVASPYNSF